ncbi:MAG TPA: APC family permease [Rhodanobacteraceae bacterium]
MPRTQTQVDHPAAEPRVQRVVSRWQLVGLGVNGVIGGGIYLLPAAAAALLGVASVWAVFVAGIVASLLVLCYAQAASCFDATGGEYLYAREAFGGFVGFEVGWMELLTDIAAIAALSNGLATTLATFVPALAAGPGRVAVVLATLLLLGWINIVGMRAAARTDVALAIAKLLPLLLFIGIGVVLLAPHGGPHFWVVPNSVHHLGKTVALLLFAYSGFEGLPVAAGEYHDPRRNVPFALIVTIAVVTVAYVAIQWVTVGSVAGLAHASDPLSAAAAALSGNWLVGVMVVGGVISIFGTIASGFTYAPRYLLALAGDGFGPARLARIHPRYRTPALAVVVVCAAAMLLALTRSFVALALLSMVARLFGYLSTSLSVLVFHRRHAGRAHVLRLPGGPVIPVLACLFCLGLLASAGLGNVLAGLGALAVGALIFRFGRRRA